jgi:hypothetical protein
MSGKVREIKNKSQQEPSSRHQPLQISFSAPVSSPLTTGQEDSSLLPRFFTGTYLVSYREQMSPLDGLHQKTDSKRGKAITREKRLDGPFIKRITVPFSFLS